jgi:hypothetical protein
MARLSDHVAHKPPPVRSRTLRIEIAPSTIVTIVSITVGIALLTQLVPVILVLVTGLMLVGTLSPAVEWLERHKVGRLAAIAIVFTALLVVLAALAVFTVPAFVIQVGSLVAQEPALRGKLVKFLSAYPLTTSLAETLRHMQYGELFKSYSTEAIAFSRSLFEIVAYGAGSIFLALYVMIDRDRLRGALFAVVPRAHHMKLSRIMLKLETIVGGYVRGQIVTCAMMAIFLFIVLSACGVRRHCRRPAFRRHLPYHDPRRPRGARHRQRGGHGGVRAVAVLRGVRKPGPDADHLRPCAAAAVVHRAVCADYRRHAVRHCGGPACITCGGNPADAGRRTEARTAG